MYKYIIQYKDHIRLDKICLRVIILYKYISYNFVLLVILDIIFFKLIFVKNKKIF